MAHRKWDEETIAQALAPLVAEHGRMPTRTELTNRGLSGLWSAMRRNGGTRVWADRAGELAASLTATGQASGELAEELTPGQILSIEERIRLRAYFLAVEGEPGGPVAHWLRAEREVRA